MALYYAVEFPLEDSKGPYIVPENKVKVENGQTQVLWSVVDEFGDVMEEYFQATNLKKGSKKDCGDFIDNLKKAKEKAEINNKEGRSRKKPLKLDDYEDPDNLNSTKPAMKRRRKALFQIQLDSPKAPGTKDVSSSADESEEEYDNEELDGSAVLAHWKQNVAKKKAANGFSRPNKNTQIKSQSKSSSKPKKIGKPCTKENVKKAVGSKSKNAVKKAREETADSQSCEIGKSLALEMKVIRHGCNGSRPVEFSMSVSPSSTYGTLRKQLSQMTGILPANQLIIIKGDEWIMEDYKLITDVWSPDELVAISEKGTQLIELSNGETKETGSMGETQLNQETIDEVQLEDEGDEFIEGTDSIDDEAWNWTGALEETGISTPQDKGAASHKEKGTPPSHSTGPSSDLEERVDKLHCQMSLMTDEIRKMGALIQEFASCKACIKKLYKTTPLDEKSPVSTPSVSPSAPDPAKPHSIQQQSSTPTPKPPNITETPLIKNKNFSENVDGSPSNLVLIGAPSRGVYVGKERLESIKTSCPKRFALKLFELVFGREEAKEGSVEGKADKLSRLDPNRLAAVDEQTKRRFSEDERYSWLEIKRGIDEKCRMVRNNRCFVWAGVNVKTQ